MAKVHFITYGDRKYDKSKKRITEEARSSGWFDTVAAYGPEDLSPAFCEEFKAVLTRARGGGYWSWKFDLIPRMLEQIDEGDFLVYVDSGCHINRRGEERFKQYLQLLKESEYGVLSFQMSFVERQWTTKQILQAFDVAIDSDIATSGQYVGGILVIQKNAHSVELYNRCLEVFQKNPLLITDHYNKIDQESYFRDNRHDQSIQSIAKKLLGVVTLKDETWFPIFGTQESLKYPFWACRSRG